MTFYPTAYERDRSGAIISSDELYRYLLWRDWDPSLPVITWIMLNPSTANALEDDPTIRRVLAFSRAWGFGSIEVVNLYAYRATSPRDLPRWGKDGPSNSAYILAATPRGRTVVCAWGTHGGWKQPRTGGADDIYCMGVNKDGSPKHPLYLSSSTVLERF